MKKKLLIWTLVALLLVVAYLGHLQIKEFIPKDWYRSAYDCAMSQGVGSC